MDDRIEAKLRGPWWKRKRWWAAAVLVLLAAYPASVGPAMYAMWRDWISREAFRGWYGPVLAAAENESGRNPIRPYVKWWEGLLLQMEREEVWADYQRAQEFERQARERLRKEGKAR